MLAAVRVRTRGGVCTAIKGIFNQMLDEQRLMTLIIKWGISARSATPDKLELISIAVILHEEVLLSTE